ncbi:hypothetical protein TVAG_062660 [Trichomonas vaginalis G3]|uniref:Uncharacterized protein n=1 Tax=Trichomonas vaginalis (strain ATCC PRA-98 / G3) TaxID=412133 RepID=A2DLM8_TRIV3|nr:hypothetical protein TVAGG3_0580550 [Trichomonas vaginalis G3]EAY18661.1 hypothetical protein TVAG_062660 [Trichomonas vaginalis G3]KAI5522546.1 hypothetical protein TVAGG3_0580550 [Trichomonas vaginalis G3]|eukprot:XP_001579647.1 hypothetical protein [Trichomonas vaginalis G3]
MLSFFFSLSRSACDLSISPDAGPILGCYCPSKGKTICVNSTKPQYFLVFNKLNNRTVIKHYHAYNKDDESYFDYEALQSSLLYAIRTKSLKNSFDFTILEDSCQCISTFSSEQCPDGVLLLNGNTQYIDLPSSYYTYFDISYTVKKCIFISDPKPFSIQGAFQSINPNDQICIHQNGKMDCYKSLQPFNYSNTINNLTALIQFNFENLDSSRSFQLYINGTSEPKSIYYGVMDTDPFTPIPLPTQYIYVEKLSLTPLIALSTSVVFFMISCAILLRANMCFGKCTGNDSLVDGMAKMPSELIRSQQ